MVISTYFTTKSQRVVKMGRLLFTESLPLSCAMFLYFYGVSFNMNKNFNALPVMFKFTFIEIKYVFIDSESPLVCR